MAEKQKEPDFSGSFHNNIIILIQDLTKLNQSLFEIYICRKSSFSYSISVFF